MGIGRARCAPNSWLLRLPALPALGAAEKSPESRHHRTDCRRAGRPYITLSNRWKLKNAPGQLGEGVLPSHSAETTIHVHPCSFFESSTLDYLAEPQENPNESQPRNFEEPRI